MSFFGVVVKNIGNQITILTFFEYKVPGCFLTDIKMDKPTAMMRNSLRSTVVLLLHNFTFSNINQSDNIIYSTFADNEIVFVKKHINQFIKIKQNRGTETYYFQGKVLICSMAAALNSEADKLSSHFASKEVCVAGVFT